AIKCIGWEILQQNVAPGAFYDAAERGDPPKCHPDTRLAILAKITEWIKDLDSRRQFFIWLYGPAGVGKSAIAQTIAEMCAREALLAASFFFSRTVSGRNNETRFIASVAYQLSLSIPKIRERVITAVEQDPMIFSRTVITQMRVLVVEPLNEATKDEELDGQALSVRPGFVVVDGLDECHDDTAQTAILDALADSSVMQGLALDDNYQSDEDIRTFLRSKFKDIRRFHPAGGDLPPGWPSEEDTESLVEKSSGQFIYAATVGNPGKETPFSELDGLYRLILSSVDDIQRVMEILTLLILSRGECYLPLTVGFVEVFLGYDPGDVRTALTDMHALIQVHPPGDDTNNLRIYHASLHDFLMDRSRSGDFFLNAKTGHTNLARHCVRSLAKIPQSSTAPTILRDIIRGFIGHIIQSGLADELANDLEHFSPETSFRALSFLIWFNQPWSRFFEFLRDQASTISEKKLFLRLRNEYDKCILNLLEKYPNEIRCCILAIFSVPDHAGTYIQDIFNILVHGMDIASSHFFRILELDKTLLFFSEWPTLINREQNYQLRELFQDPSRAGPYSADGSNCAKLVRQLVECLYQQRSEGRSLEIRDLATRAPRYDKLVLRLEYPSLKYIPELLAASSKDPNLAIFLRDRVLQYHSDDTIADGRQAVGIASLKYVKVSLPFECHIPYLEHEHDPECDICIICESLAETQSVIGTTFEDDDNPKNVLAAAQLRSLRKRLLEASLLQEKETETS
ncbi:hypothetical protein BDZ97DRAFT_1919012, partial [Flammula alnicola]